MSSKILGTLGTTSLDPSPQKKSKCSHLLSFIFMRVGTLGKTLWNKSEVLLGTSWELGEPCKKQDENTLRTPPKKKSKIKNQKSPSHY